MQEKSTGDITIECIITETQGKNTQKNINATVTKGTLLSIGMYI